MMLTAFAEIIESSLKSVSALCWDPEHIPPFGTIVKITYGNIISYGIITNIVTASADDSRTPFAFKQTPESLRKNQPQIFAFIQTTCTIVLTWHNTKTSEDLSSLPVPYPAPLHTWVEGAPIEMSTQALIHATSLEAIVEAIEPSTADDCLIAIAAHACTKNALSYAQLVGFIEKYSQEINNDLRRAKRFLQHMERILKSIRKS